jgi:hypothetical protein|tara:strand:+ start:60 stop:509 length:450 start_codon:yes stop_codon:yes gene_type:complete
MSDINEFLTREGKQWWGFKNKKNYNPIPIIKIDIYNILEYKQQIQESINCFLSELKWDEMWTVDIAIDRINNGMVLFLLRDNDGALGHTWFSKNQWFNWYVHSRRKPGISIKFIESCWNQLEYDDIICWCEPWNVKAQEGFKKLGGIKN